METIKDKFQLFGFQPIETPSFENSETLMGKYGDEGDRLIFKILNSGDFLNKVDYELDKFGDFSSRMTSFVQSLSYEINELIGSSLRSNRELIPLYNEYLQDSKIISIYDLEKDSKLRFYDDESPSFEYAIKNFRDTILYKVFDAIRNRNEIDDLASKISETISYNYNISQNFLREFYKVALTKSIESNKFAIEVSEKALRYDLTVPLSLIHI